MVKGGYLGLFFIDNIYIIFVKYIIEENRVFFLIYVFYLFGVV